MSGPTHMDCQQRQRSGGARPRVPPGPGQVNLLGDLEELLAVSPQPAPRGGGRPEASKKRRKGKPGGSSGVAPGPGPRPSLRDPELYAALMEECCREESLPRGEEYVPTPLVANYLVRNDVRPLKKVV